MSDKFSVRGKCDALYLVTVCAPSATFLYTHARRNFTDVKRLLAHFAKVNRRNARRYSILMRYRIFIPRSSSRKSSLDDRKADAASRIWLSNGSLVRSRGCRVLSSAESLSSQPASSTKLYTRSLRPRTSYARSLPVKYLSRHRAMLRLYVARLTRPSPGNANCAPRVSSR